MANKEHLALLQQGTQSWNAWVAENPAIRPDLSAANLANADLIGAYLINTNLGGATLGGARLTSANLSGANLSSTDLSGSDLRLATLYGANLHGAKLHQAKLRQANFSRANLFYADVSDAHLGNTVFGNTDLTKTKGLDSCQHSGPSIVDQRTLERSENVPISFWRGCGLSEALIDYLPSLLNESLQFYSCFISYSSKDQEFADRLHTDLQSKGVRCWFAPHDLAIGAKTWDGIDEAIRTRDKVLLVLSENAIVSDWVEDEATKAFAEERRRNELVLFPIRLDDAVMETVEPWAGKLRDNRNIGDFRFWKNYDAYQKAFERILRDLRPNSEVPPLS